MLVYQRVVSAFREKTNIHLVSMVGHSFVKGRVLEVQILFGRVEISDMLIQLHSSSEK
jgi:hypothetical protein